ncbi:uncharacterized protein [Branchiostoma lanceolatum]|uniref:uncharacterized protein n=1 Tax=Branchiostoma lanceolatum TaxID=7740 RepID=UPI003453A00E
MASRQNLTPVMNVAKGSPKRLIGTAIVSYTCVQSFPFTRRERQGWRHQMKPRLSPKTLTKWLNRRGSMKERQRLLPGKPAENCGGDSYTSRLASMRARHSNGCWNMTLDILNSCSRHIVWKASQVHFSSGRSRDCWSLSGSSQKSPASWTGHWRKLRKQRSEKKRHSCSRVMTSMQLMQNCWLLQKAVLTTLSCQSTHRLPPGEISHQLGSKALTTGPVHPLHQNRHPTASSWRAGRSSGTTLPPTSTQAPGVSAPNIKWLKDNETYGLFEPASTYRNAKGETVERKQLKKKMEFHPPPLPTSVKGAVPNMLAFFTTPAFFWRPVGVMQAKIRCPNTNCQAPPGEYLELKGFGSFARQVCGMKNYYTLLTEKLKCPYCEKARQSGAGPQQYLWMANSIKILMQLAPAIRRLFPAIICGKRAIDRGVVTLLGDRINAASMSKVQRILKQGHDEWYVERRGLFQTLLYEAHTAEATPSQKGILSFVKAPGSYTPPLPKEPLPTPTCLRRAHLIAEMERMPVYRASILSTTGEILCIDGTRKILKKIYGDGRDTMQYVTSVLNEWGQFLTTVVVAAESEDCYRRMARGLVARFQRANAPAPKIIYADNNCCRESGASFLEKLFSDWVREGMVVRLDVRHWLHRWDAVVIKQSHAKYANFMSAMAGAVLAYNRDDMMLLVQAVRKGNLDLYADRTDEEMIHFLKPHQVKDYVRRVTRGVEETASVVEDIIAEFKGPGGLDIDGIHLFKSLDAVDAHWSIASKHLCCMQDPPGIQLYVAVKEVVLNGVKLNKYRCRRGSNSLEGLHSHLYNAVPSKRCGILPFQVYLISFAVQWNSQMDSLRVAGGKGRQTTCIDAKQIQLLNQQAEFLFGKNHVLEPNFVAPLPYPTLTSTTTQRRRSFSVWSMPSVSPPTSLQGITMQRKWKKSRLVKLRSLVKVIARSRLNRVKRSQKMRVLTCRQKTLTWTASVEAMSG